MQYFDYPIIGTEKNLPLYILNMGLHECQDHVIRREGYPFAQILYFTKGSGTLILNGQNYHIAEHTAIFLPAYYPHEYYANEAVWDTHWIVPEGTALASLLAHFHLTEPGIFRLTKIQRLEQLFRSMHEALHSDHLYGNYRASGYLYEFLLEFYRVISVKESGHNSNPLVTKAIDYINLHYQEQITLEDLCSLCGVTKQHLCLLFRTTLHTRPMEYIAKRRLQTAKELLTGSHKTIEEIAEETGFCTASYFCKLFKRYEGITAMQFKHNYA